MDTDEALYARTRDGDMVAFDELYARYETRLFGFLIHQLKNRADAEDAFHEVFLAAIRSEATFDREGGFRTWIYRIARNHTLNRYRSSGRSERALERARVVEAEPVVQADVAIARAEMFAALDTAVARLPESLAEVYHLRSSGLSYEEMSLVLEIPLGTIKSRMNQLVGVLRKELESWTA